MRNNFVAKNANKYNRSAVFLDRKKAYVPEIDLSEVEMKKPKLVIFNCPPRSGKDETAYQLMKKHSNVDSLSFKERLIWITLSIYGLSEQEWHDRYITDKETPWDKLDGLSQRQALIKVSEEVIKPNFGKDFFGKALLSRFNKLSKVSEDVDYWIVTDGGFDEEVEALVGTDVVILQWDADFSGKVTNFNNDSRNWITVPGIPTYKLPRNSGTPEEYADNVYQFLESLNSID